MVLLSCVSVKVGVDFWLASLSNSGYFRPGYKFEMFGGFCLVVGFFSTRRSACKLIKRIGGRIFIRLLFSCTC